MTKTENGIKLTQEETAELLESGYVVSEDERFCVVDMDGTLLTFERKQFIQLSIYDIMEE